MSGTTNPAAFSDADWVIEAVFEELSVKQDVFANIEQFIAEDAILATNTSSLSVNEIGAKLKEAVRLSLVKTVVHPLLMAGVGWALGMRGFPGSRNKGYTLAILRRCLNWANEALAALIQNQHRHHFFAYVVFDLC